MQILLRKKLRESKAVIVEDEDRVSPSLFARIESLPDVRFLIGSRKFIEGWSSFRVSALGLINLGKNAGTQVIQLFGRGVRLRGIGGQLKRADFVPTLGPHPDEVKVSETLYVFGVRADYVQTWLDALKREGMPGQREILPVEIRGDVNSLALQVPSFDSAREAEFAAQPIPFSVADAGDATIDLAPRLVAQSGTGQVQSLVEKDISERSAGDLLASQSFSETLFQHAQRSLKQTDAQRVWVTRADATAWLAGVRVLRHAQAQPLTRELRERVKEELLVAWEAALSRVLRRARLRFLTKYMTLEMLSDEHSNFPAQKRHRRHAEARLFD